MGTVDTRWTFFQVPLTVEDALGLKFPVPSEYNYALLDTIIKHRFQEGPGSLDVRVGNYEVFSSKNSGRIISAGDRLLPGMNLTMAILINKPVLEDQNCPMRRCGSNRTTAVAGGGRTWYGGLFYPYIRISTY
jgi:hypothetical protein